MSLVTMAIVNGVFVVCLLAAVAYVCSLPFRLAALEPDRASPPLLRDPDVRSEGQDRRSMRSMPVAA